LFLVSLVTFFLVELVPGDPAVAALGSEATEERLDVARAEMGLDRPVAERYLDWLGSAVTGDLGNSLINPSRAVGDLLLQTLPVTLQLALMGLGFALVVSVPLAVWSAAREGTRSDQVALVLTSGLISIPSFLAGLLLAFFFVFHPDVPRTLVFGAGLVAAVALAVAALRQRHDGLATLVVIGFPELPRTGFARVTGRDGLSENLRTAFLPALTLALTEIAVFTRLLRADLITTLQEDFILAARSKGISSSRVLWRHALRPSSFSLVTLAGVSLGRLIGGTVVVETVFGIQGMGRLIVNDGVIAGDIRIVQGGVLVIAVGYVLVNLLIDLSYAYLDPRVRRG
jgi:peptide/nickel transport system permease protein